MCVDMLERPGKPSLAYVASLANDEGAVVVFIHGFKSDMDGTKAVFLEEKCREKGISFLRLDCAAHGKSGGDFAACSISSWVEDMMDVIAHVCDQRRVILIGSSMGGWLSLLAARQDSKRVVGVIGIAAAPDFTDEIFFERLGQKQRDIIMQEGKVEIPSGYENSNYVISRLLIEDGRGNFLLKEQQPIYCPIVLMQGKRDEDVPWEKAQWIKDKVMSDHVEIVFVEDGDHRLSRDQDLALLWNNVLAMHQKV